MGRVGGVRRVRRRHVAGRRVGGRVRVGGRGVAALVLVAAVARRRRRRSRVLALPQPIPCHRVRAYAAVT